LPSPGQLPKANLGDPSLTLDQNSPNTKVGPAFTNVLKSHEFCQNFTNPTWQQLKGELFEKQDLVQQSKLPIVESLVLKFKWAAFRITVFEGLQQDIML